MSIMNKLWDVSVTATTIRTGVFTAGHFIIDVFVIAIITGAPIETATLASIVGPALNGVWFWLLDRWWSQRHNDEETKMREEAFFFNGR